MDAQQAASAHEAAFPEIDARPTDESSPFVTMWLHPRRTMRRISSTYWESWAIPIAMLGGAASSVQEITPRQLTMGQSMGLEGYGLIGAMAGLSMLGSVLHVIVFGWLLAFTGDWLGGEADHEAAKAAIGWSYLPVAAVLPIGVLIVILLGPDAIIYDAGVAAGNDSPLLALAGLAFLIALIWSVVLVVASVREIQGFSTLRAIANLVLAALLPFLAIGILVAAGATLGFLVDQMG